MIVTSPDTSHQAVLWSGFVRAWSSVVCFHGPGAETQVRSRCYLQFDPQLCSLDQQT